MSEITIHNATTGEVIKREMNAQELIQWQIDKAQAEDKAQAKAEADIAKAALLNRLGITADEAKLLLS